MAFTEDRFTLGFKAASAMVPKTIVTLDSVANQVLPLTNASQRPYGAIAATGGTPGAGLAVYESPSIVKAIAAASLGYGGEVGLASIGLASAAQMNLPATTTLLGPISGASGVAKWAVGVAMSPAGAGEVFSVKLEPREVSGLV